MSSVVLAFPILADKVETWRRFCQELSNSRLQMYLLSRRRLGITHERLALVETKLGATAFTTMEAKDVAQALGQIVISNLPFDVWYRERLQEFYGVNLAGYEQFYQCLPLPDEQELLFEWSLHSSVGD